MRKSSSWRGGGGHGAFGQVGADDRKVGAVDHIEHEIQAVVELVIAERAAVVDEHVHRGDDLMHVAFLHAALVGDVIAHRIALKKIAIVDEDRVRRLGADGVDDRSGAR